MAFTADDFKNAWFARHPRTEDIAMRAKNSPFPWWVSSGPNSSDAGMAHDGWVPVQENRRPLTPDAITDEMVERAQKVIAEKSGGGFTPGEVRTYNILVAALTEPPARPEGAEEWEDWLIEALPHESMPDEDIARLADQIADHLAEPTRKKA